MMLQCLKYLLQLNVSIVSICSEEMATYLGNKCSQFAASNDGYLPDRPVCVHSTGLCADLRIIKGT